MSIEQIIGAVVEEKMSKTFNFQEIELVSPVIFDLLLEQLTPGEEKFNTELWRRSEMNHTTTNSKKSHAVCEIN